MINDMCMSTYCTTEYRYILREKRLKEKYLILISLVSLINT